MNLKKWLTDEIAGDADVFRDKRRFDATGVQSPHLLRHGHVLKIG
jgi:hypothetical protein